MKFAKSKSGVLLFFAFLLNVVTEIITKIPDNGVVEGMNANTEKEPEFSAPIKNITVPLGREAVLMCSVTDLGNYKVGWMKVEDQTILTLHNRVVTHNGRVSVTQDNFKTWQLHIRQIKETDKGCYMCQINTNVMKKQVGCIDVHVPPDISDQMTVSDVTVKEGENATLTCKAVGHPQPRIVWKREDGSSILVKKSPREVISVETYSGETLHLMKLDRRQMGSYLCIASNDVPPAVSKRITLHVTFFPVIKVQNELVGAPLGTNVTLACMIEAFPYTINYWMKTTENHILQGIKHNVEETRNAYRVHLKLTILFLTHNDLGRYVCVATNSLGKAEGIIRLNEIKLPPTTTTSTTTTTTATTTISTTITTTTTEPPTTTSYTIPYTVLPAAKSYRDQYQKTQRNQEVVKNAISLTGGSRTASFPPEYKFINNYSVIVIPDSLFTILSLFAAKIFR